MQSTRLRAIAMASVTMLALAACGDDDPVTPVVTNGSLVITVSGLPGGTSAALTVTGPNSYSQSPTAGTTLSVPPGSYTVAAAQVTATGNVKYDATVTGSPATVTSNGTSTVTVSYAVAQTPIVVLSGSIAANRTLTADTNYVLRGFVYVNSGATLTIREGTKIVGDTTALGSALFVLRGARIEALGTAAAPIVFTSQRSAGNRSPGDWGGLIVVGNARANRGANQIVEGSNGSVIGANPAGVVYTGGTVDTDNSGTLRYVRVEFAGFATLTDAELNSFTFGAVGSGTTLEYLQSLAGLDDSFEWFGGTVNGKYLVSYEAGDDHFDGSEGYRGLNQFLIGMQTTYLTPRAGAGAVSSDPQGIEIDGCNGGGCVAPSGANAQSSGRDEGLWNMNVFANFTLIGTPTGVTVPSSGGVGAVLRRGTGGYYLNGVVARWPRAAISLRDTTSNNRPVDSLIVQELVLRGERHAHQRRQLRRDGHELRTGIRLRRAQLQHRRRRRNGHGRQPLHRVAHGERNDHRGELRLVARDRLADCHGWPQHLHRRSAHRGSRRCLHHPDGLPRRRRAGWYEVVAGLDELRTQLTHTSVPV